MKTNLPKIEIARAFRNALTKGFIRREDTLLMFHNLDHLRERVNILHTAFPSSTIHGIAIKANPLMKILEFLKPLGTGVEAATQGEVYLALESGYDPGMIVYDSPVKTHEEIEYALQAGVHLNIDNLSELERFAAIREKIRSKSTIGIRINPQVGTGTIAESSVAGEYSKFGVPIKYREKELTEAFLKYDWLEGVHLHVGSQGISQEMLLKGIGVLYEFAEKINVKKAPGKIRIFDIGGGFPVSYDQSKEPPDINDYANAIRTRFPKLFSKEYKLITEFGRWVYVNSGWTASRVEYVKHDPGINTAMIHAGADLFVRECLNPSAWQHEYSVLDRNGNLKEGHDSTSWNLAGPLCFAGDILAKNVTLPPVEEGDWLVIHDTGGYTLSMWSRYNSRLMPRVLGYDQGAIGILKEREVLPDLRRIWD